MEVERTLLMEYFPDDLTCRGIPIALIRCDLAPVAPPYLRVERLHLQDLSAAPEGVTQFIEATFQDISRSASESAENALRLLKDLEGASFGPIRCRRIENDQQL
jgi:hypothetical protein